MLVYELSTVTVVATANHHILTILLNYKAQLIPVLTVPSVLAVACAQMVLAASVSSFSTCWNLPESSKAGAFLFPGPGLLMPLPGLIFPSPTESSLRLFSDV